jgi:hypothetical protein
MSGRNVAWTTAAATGIGCAILAASAAWLLLTQPVAVTRALERNDLAAVFGALVSAVLDLAAAVVRMF